MKPLFFTFMVLLLSAVPVCAQWATSGTNINNTNTGNVGIGTSAPNGKLTIADPGTGNTLFLLGRPSDSTGGFQFRNSGNSTTLGYVIVDNSEFRFFHLNGFLAFYSGGVERMRVTATGNVGIGTTSPTAKLHVNGNAHFAGTVTGSNIQAQYQDVAEWVPATEALTPGSVVVIDSSGRNRVMPSAQPYDTRVAGVVSSQPGLLLGVGGPNQEMIATTGRVKVRVDASTASIEVGDLLVTSAVPGTAMKSLPLKAADAEFHRPGTIVGKALEPLQSGQGEILVLLSLQ